MKKVVLLVVTCIILSIASSAYAKFWGWEITSMYSWISWLGDWEDAGGLYNPTPYTSTLSKTFSSTRYVKISACVGLVDVIEAKIGFETGEQITRTYTVTVELPPYSGVNVYERWKAKYYCGSAVKYEFWEIVDATNWDAYVPKALYYKLEDAR